MTEKRFERIYADVDVFCRDHNAKGLSQLIEKEDYDTIVDLLNSLNDENEQLKSRLQYLETKLQRERKSNTEQHQKWDKQANKRITELENEIKDFQDLLAGKEEELLKPILNTIKDAMENERTTIGQNVLKQLLEAINE